MDPLPEDREGGEQAPSHALPGAAWLGGWLCIFALGAWLAQLLPAWLALAAGGAVSWSWGVRRASGRVPLAAAVLLWAGIGTAAGVQYRLWDVARNWMAVERRVEDRAAAMLNRALDDLVERGESAVSGAAETVGGRRVVTPGPGLFSRLELVHEATGVSAVAIFDARGSPLAWAGEHRGAVPIAALRGADRYIFNEGPLFSYLYFSRPLAHGRTAVAAVLLESSLPPGEEVPFAERFAGRHGLTPVFTAPSRPHGETVWDWSTDRPILSVSFATLTQQHWWDRVVRRGQLGAGVLWLAALSLLVLAWYRGRPAPAGVPVALVTLALLVAPAGEMMGMEGLFSPVQFVLPLPVDVSLGPLLVLLAGSGVWTLTRLGGSRRWRARLPGWAQAAAALVLVPLVLELVRRSASGTLLAGRPGGGFALQLATTLLLAIPFFLLLSAARRPRNTRASRLATLGAGAATAVAIAVALVTLWRPELEVPWWLGAVWALPFALVARAAPRRTTRNGALWAWLVAGGLGATIALPHLWVMHVEAKLASAELELRRLGTETDPFLDFLLRQFADRADRFAEAGEQGVNLLYHSWVASGLAREGYEAQLAIWQGGEVESTLRLSESAALPDLVREAVVVAEGTPAPVVQRFVDVPGLHYLLLAPLPGGRTVSVAVPPRSRLGGATALARFLHADRDAEPGSTVESLYLVPVTNPAQDSLAPRDPSDGPAPVHWMPTEAGWRSEARAHFPDGWMHAHLFVRTSLLPLLLIRGLLTATALLAVLLGGWALARLICRDLTGALLVRRRWIRSFRGRVVLALFAFFLVPTAVLGVVAYGAVSREVFRSASGLARRALEQSVPELSRVPISEVGTRVGTDLLLYFRGTLVNAASREVLDLGLFQAWLSPEVYLTFASGEDLEEVEPRRLGANDYLVAYRRLDADVVLAAPIALASEEIARRQTEFRDIALLMSLLGAAFSIGLSLLVGRTLTRPIDQLSQAAAMVGAGNLRVGLPEERPDEFGGVYRSFNRMVRRLRRARSALVHETRRTEMIVAEAATGVLALDALGRVELVNPRAAEVLGTLPEAGSPLPRHAPLLAAVADAFDDFWRSGTTEASAELETEGRIVRLRMRRVTPLQGTRGAVVALEDVTSEVRTARVLAWGEMARQIAHEIKNPLTPIKLAVQHLRRAFRDGRPDFEQILERNVEAILQEIDRLGEIARAFSRFGTPEPMGEQPESVDVVRAVEDTLALYRGAGGGIRYRLELDAAAGLRARARLGELKEVLVNLLENARDALNGEGEITVSARRVEETGEVELVVADTGEGIPQELLPRIFEPHFSTRTSGTGLGLAIVRRMVESWGGEISAESEPGAGTRMRVRMAPADPA